MVARRKRYRAEVSTGIKVGLDIYVRAVTNTFAVWYGSSIKRVCMIGG